MNPKELRQKTERGKQSSTKLFLSYRIKDGQFVECVNHCLLTQENVRTFFYPEERNSDRWDDLIDKGIKACDTFVLFLGRSLGKTEHTEALKAQHKKCRRLVVKLPGGRAVQRLPADLNCFHHLDPIRIVEPLDELCAEETARKIIELIDRTWVRPDPIPAAYPFEYEKDIIREYIKGDGRLPANLVTLGCPETWPKVARRGRKTRDNQTDREKGYKNNPVEAAVIGRYRDVEMVGCEKRAKDPQVVAAALTECHQPNCHVCLVRDDLRLTFPEAGPRELHYYPKRENNSLTVGILVSGGIAPGINAVISRNRRTPRAICQDTRKNAVCPSTDQLLSPRVQVPRRARRSGVDRTMRRSHSTT